MSRPGYDVRGFGSMIADRGRIRAYAAALERSVGPESVVLDVGTGTGIMALLAARMGARRVFAVEPDDVIQLGREAARANGLADRIEFIQGLSTEVELPERADVVVADLRGVLPPAYPLIESMLDVRRRHLAPGGVLIPRSDAIMVAPVHAPDGYEAIVRPWRDGNLGLDLSASLRASLNSWGKVELTAAQLIAPPGTWAVLDYLTVADPNVGGRVEWTVERAATGHGLAAWFEATLAEGIGFSTGPGAPETVYGTAFFPWLEPLELNPGDAVGVDLQARCIGSEYVWGWTTVVERTDGSRTEFRQSTLQGNPISPETLRRRAHGFRPRPGEDARIAQAVLSMMDGSATLGEIAAVLMRDYPDRFASWEAALSLAGALSQQYAE